MALPELNLRRQPADDGRPLGVEEGRRVKDLDDGGHHPVERFREFVANRGEAEEHIRKNNY